jgi:Methyltransferase FkbM domain
MKVENFGEAWIDFELPFPCEVHHCFPQKQPSPERYSVLNHYTEPRPLKAQNDDVRRYHQDFNLILTNEESLLDLPNVRFSLFGGKWVSRVPQTKTFDVSFLYSNGVGHEQFFSGYRDRRVIWDRKTEITIPKSFYTSTKRPPADIADLNPYPYQLKDKLFDSMFSIIVENAYEPHYFTEKLIDAFSTYTVPIYLGAQNISKYFRTDGMIIPKSLDEMFETINSLSAEDYWRRLPALVENHELSGPFWNQVSALRQNIIASRAGTTQSAPIQPRLEFQERVLSEIASLGDRVDALRQELGKDTPAPGNKKSGPEFIFVKTDPVIVRKDPVVVCAPDQAMGETARSILSLVSPMDVVGGNLVRMGCPNDGGYVLLESGLREAVAYSLGIAGDVSWDLEMAGLGCQIYQYDHTIEALPQEHPAFHWFRIGIAAQDSADGTMCRLDTLITRNGHAGRNDLVLKMDIEGSEWDLFEAMPVETLRQFSQIVMEMHHFAVAANHPSGLLYLKKFEAVLRKLDATHQAVHIHANNNGALAIIGGTIIPDLLEMTYVRRSDHQFVECRRIFPTPLDMPNMPQAPDYFLGAVGALRAASQA